jgi:hypothetical protein
LEFLIGPFRTSPLGTVPKSLDSDDRRIVQDLSFPRNDPNHSSVNNQINIEDFRCDWGTFNDVRKIVIDAPEGAEAATLDVDSAFRCCPILPSQQCNFVIHWNDSYYVDHCAPFGATSAGGVFGRVADAKSAILESEDIVPSKNWVDDFVFLGFPFYFSRPPPFLIHFRTYMPWHAVSDGHGKNLRHAPFHLSSSISASCGIWLLKRSKFPSRKSLVTY